MNRTRIAALATAAGLAGTVAFAAVPAAQAKDGDVIKTGTCSQGSTWKLKASPQNGAIQVEAEVDSNVNGQAWRWRIRHNGNLAARGNATTVAPSGSFEVRRVVDNAAGTDRIVFRATNPTTGEICQGALT